MWDKILRIILVFAILGALGIIGYVIATPKVGERFTEFYLLGLEDKAADYPEELKVGEEGRVTVGIVNWEHETMGYRVEVRVEGIRNTEVETIVLEHDEKWEEEIGFIPKIASEKQKVEFLLYKEGQSEVYQTLYLWVDVKE